MSYEDIVEAQVKRNVKEAAVVRSAKALNPWWGWLKHGKSEMEVAKDEIEALEFGNHCSVLQR